ncbi:MAG: glycosyltransferase family 2 protein [Mangrovibacterium sp.]
MIKISAIISTFNRAHFLDGLFQSILAQTIDSSCYEIVLVNNNSTDDTERKCRTFMAENPTLIMKYVVETNQGLSFGRNRGIQESNAPYLTFLDDDAVLTNDFFEQTIRFFDNHHEVSAIGGKILLKYLVGKPAWYNPFLASLLGFFDKGNKQQKFTNDYFRGSNMSFRADVFLRHEAFNTKLGRVGRQLYGNEEKELFYRLQAAGETMYYVPEAVVLHLVPKERTTTLFIKKQGIGTGISQRQQAEIKGRFAVGVAMFKEVLKWLASFGLALIYGVQFKFAVASMLIRFRWWVSEGMICKNASEKLR